jgi:flavorubredoxin
MCGRRSGAHGEGMETTISEIAPDIFRLSTYVPEVAAPAGFTFNQFVVRGEQPFLFHTGMRQLFPLVSEAVEKVAGLDRLRWISFGHVEADECGSVNQFLAAAPQAEVTHGGLGCMVSLNDLCDRPPVPADGQAFDLGGHVLRFIATPHVPHNWESGVWFDETTKTLLGGDLFTSLGDGAPIVETDLVEGALVAEDVFHATSVSPTVVSTIRSLAELEPETIAVMHGSSFHGDGGAQLRALADAYEALG